MVAIQEVTAKAVVNSIPHTKFSVTKGLSCRLSMNTSFGCETSCSYCYIRYLARWKGIEPNDIFRDIRVRVNAPQCLEKELRGRAKEWMWIGSTQDPYQGFEERYRLMRGCLSVLGEERFPYEIITKSPLVARDADLLARSRDVGFVSMSLFSSLDDKKRSRIELKARPVRERLEALAHLNAANVRTMALLLPIIPGYSDDTGEIRELLREVRRAGTTRLYAGVMRLYPVTWSAMQRMMAPSISGLRDHIDRIYNGPDHSISASARVPARGYRRALMAAIGTIAREEGFTQYQCEDNFFDLWFGPQDEHAGFRYSIHYDFWRARNDLGGEPLTLANALAIARSFHHTLSFLRSIETNLPLLNRLTDPAVIEAECDDE